MDVQGSRGLVCGGVTDEHGLQAVGELQASVHPLVLWRADDVADHPPHSWIGHSEGGGCHRPAGEGHLQVSRQVANVLIQFITKTCCFHGSVDFSSPLCDLLDLFLHDSSLIPELYTT